MMKKTLIIVSLLVITICLFVSCSVNSNFDDIATTAVTDKQGTTHYYQPVKENVSTSTYVEIATDNKGYAVTKKNGAYATKEHTTILTTNVTSLTTAKNNKVTTNSTIQPDKSDVADNVVEFETKVDKNTTASKRITATTAKEATKSVTDKDGWIDKWY